MQKALFQKIESAPPVDFGSILSRSFELFKKAWQPGLIHALIAGILVIPVILMIYIPLIPFYIRSFDRGYYYYDDYYYQEPLFDHPALFIILYILIILVVSFFAQTVAYGIAAHFYKVLKNIDMETDEDTGGYFHFLKGKHLGKVFVLSLAGFGIAILATLLCYLPIFYVMVPLQLFAIMFAFNPDLSVSEIINACFKLGHKYWLILFGLIIVSGLIAQLGLILCIIGVIATAYFVHLPMYYFYKDTIGFGEDGTNSVSPENHFNPDDDLIVRE